MAVTPTDVRAIAPEFTATSDGTISAFLTDAQTLFGTRGYADAVAQDFVTKWGAAHLLSMAQGAGGNGAKGPVTAERVGELSRNYGFQQLSGKALLSELAMTRYGQVLATYLRRNAIHAAVVG